MALQAKWLSDCLNNNEQPNLSMTDSMFERILYVFQQHENLVFLSTGLLWRHEPIHQCTRVRVTFADAVSDPMLIIKWMFIENFEPCPSIDPYNEQSMRAVLFRLWTCPKVKKLDVNQHLVRLYKDGLWDGLNDQFYSMNELSTIDESKDDCDDNQYFYITDETKRTTQFTDMSMGLFPKLSVQSTNLFHQIRNMSVQWNWRLLRTPLFDQYLDANHVDGLDRDWLNIFLGRFFCSRTERWDIQNDWKQVFTLTGFGAHQLIEFVEKLSSQMDKYDFCLTSIPSRHTAVHNQKDNVSNDPMDEAVIMCCDRKDIDEDIEPNDQTVVKADDVYTSRTEALDFYMSLESFDSWKKAAKEFYKSPPSYLSVPKGPMLCSSTLLTHALNPVTSRLLQPGWFVKSWHLPKAVSPDLWTQITQEEVPQLLRKWIVAYQDELTIRKTRHAIQQNKRRSTTQNDVNKKNNSSTIVIPTVDVNMQVDALHDDPNEQVKVTVEISLGKRFDIPIDCNAQQQEQRIKRRKRT